ncbi:MAG: site-specific integrase [Deltaproteobacteria bacterium]|nr:site-specific integrase [Deltaproteobacteria bacterium]
MAKIERVERGLYRVENKDGTISWMIDYLNPDKKRVRKTFDTKKKAVEERAKRIAMIAEGEYSEFIKKRKSYNSTFKDLIELYEKNYLDQASYKTAKKFFIEKFRKYFGEDTLLSSIEYGHLKTYRNALMKSLNQHGRLLTPSSINSEMSCLRQMFREAFEYKMIEKNPFNDGKSLRLKVNNERDRFLTPNEARKLFNECPIHLQQIVECVLYTGMRRKEVLTLKWKQIRNGWIYLKDTKTKKPLQIPISDQLSGLFDRIKDSQGSDNGNVFDLKGKRIKRTVKSEYVFTYKGEPIKDAKTALQAACKEAGIPYGRYVPNGITFHDLRHSYGSYLMEQGANFRATQELMGHKDPKMTQRYTHVADDTKKRAVNSLDWDLHEKNSVPVHAS